MNDHDRWCLVLAELRAGLARAADQVTPGMAIPPDAAPAVWLPPELGPLPPALRAEAEAVLAELRALSPGLERRRDQVRRELAGLGRRGSAHGAGAPQLVDHHL